MSVSILGRYAFGVCAATAMLAGCGGHTGGSAVPPVTGRGDVLPHRHTFHYTGSKQSFKVPTGVRLITVVARGAVGGGVYNGYGGGRGGRVFAVIPVRPAATLYVFVGGAGAPNTAAGGFNGGALGGAFPYCQGSYCYGYGGGGASDVREGGDSLSDRIVVAGGGGGAGSCDILGGGGGGKIGDNGGSGGYCGSQSYSGGAGGDGGTQNQGGSGGAGQHGPYGNGGSGSPGTLGSGGSGGQAGSNGSCRSSCYGGGAGGGGGGGYYGGGGGGGGNAGATDQYIGGFGGGGGGGSGYAESTATNVRMWQNWKNATANGLVAFSW
ncbi:MAG: hypothetical protein WB438_09295 [Candidatus Cybelea sp.]